MQQRTSQLETQSGEIRNIVEKFQIPKKKGIKLRIQH